MNRSFVPLIAAAVVAAVVAAAPSGAVDQPAGLHVVAKTISEGGPKGRPHPGDTIVFSEKTTGEDTGHGYVQCTLIDSRRALCIGHWRLGKGTISAQTVVPLEPEPKHLTLAITGGTGAYEGVRGTGRFTDIGHDKTDEVFSFVR